MNLYFEKITLVFMVLCVVVLFIQNSQLNNKIENFNNNDIVEHTTNSNTMTREETLALIQQEYNYDLEAIRNLGAISKSLITGKNYHNTDPVAVESGTVTIPANVNTLGSLSVGGYELLPAGCIIMWSTREIPQGWVICDGNGTYTNASGVQTNIPNLQGRFILGAGKPDNANNADWDSKNKNAGYPQGTDYPVGGTSGQNKVTLTQNEMPSHTHSVVQMVADHYVDGVDSTTRHSGDHHNQGLSTGATGGNQPHNNMPPYYVLIYIIKVY